MKKAILMAVILMFTPALAHADVVLNLALGTLLKDTSNPLGPNSMLVLLADTGNNGFGDLTLGNVFSNQSDDKVLGVFGSNDALGTPGTSFEALSYSYTGLAVNNPLLLVWYDTPFVPSAMGPGAGVNFGTYRSNTADIGGDIGWFNPADGATVALNFLTVDQGGETPNAAGIASFQTVTNVPEPVSTVLALIGGGAMAFRRKFLGASV